MGARQKLNQAYVNGALVCGGFVGLVTESWFWFFLVLFVCLAGSYSDGEIRSRRGRRR